MSCSFMYAVWNALCTRPDAALRRYWDRQQQWYTHRDRDKPRRDNRWVVQLDEFPFTMLFQLHSQKDTQLPQGPRVTSPLFRRWVRVFLR